MCKHDDERELRLVRTKWFSVLARTDGDDDDDDTCSGPQHHPIPTTSSVRVVVNQQDVPTIELAELLLHQHRQSTEQVQRNLNQYLKEFGFCFLTSPKNGSSSSSSSNRASRLIQELRASLSSDFFPTTPSSSSTTAAVKGATITTTTTNAAQLQTSDEVYVSERGVPMYRLGYELCEDGVREVFRVAAGNPDAVEWPVSSTLTKNSDVDAAATGRSAAPVDSSSLSTRTLWLHSLGLMRHICDTALDLLLRTPSHHNCNKKQQPSLWWSEHGSKRQYSGSATWYVRRSADRRRRIRPFPPPPPLRVRRGDHSVLYGMHYFNTDDVGTCCVSEGIAVKAHVDPSLLVLEPFLCQDTTGLQVWDRHQLCWMDCDGPQSPVAHLWDTQEVLLLFVGKALSAVATSLEPTLHRVVTGNRPRWTVIYEQKYEELFPPPILD